MKSNQHNHLPRADLLQKEFGMNPFHHYGIPCRIRHRYTSASFTSLSLSSLQKISDLNFHLNFPPKMHRIFPRIFLSPHPKESQRHNLKLRGSRNQLCRCNRNSPPSCTTSNRSPKSGGGSVPRTATHTWTVYASYSSCGGTREVAE